LESTSSDSSTAAAAQTELNLKPRLRDQVRDCMRRRHYSVRTEKVYVGCIRRFILFHDKRHPKDMGPDEANAFLSHLAGREHVAASTQNQALSALLFLYRHILESPLPWLDDMERAKRPARLPTVLTVREVQAVLAQMQGTRRLMAALLYGAGLRLLEMPDVAGQGHCIRARPADRSRCQGVSGPGHRSAGLVERWVEGASAACEGAA
jgi:site-specific recombinase XerD